MSFDITVIGTIIGVIAIMVAGAVIGHRFIINKLTYHTDNDE